MFDIINIVFLAIILLISIGLHEYAHAVASFSLGDPTPKLQNRLTPNPFAHVDIIGFLAIFIIHFGRGKPVQINPRYYKNPLRDELIVSLAGPFTNILLSIAGILILFIYAKFGMGIQSSLEILLRYESNLVLQFWLLFSIINIGLALFNMIPFPPLDGYRLIKFFFPQVGAFFEQNILMFTLILFFMLGAISPFLSIITNFIFNYFFTMISRIFY